MVNYLTDVWRCRYFWISLVRMDLRTRYRRSVLGLGWSMLHPLLMTAILCVVFHRLFKADILNFAPFLLSGLACWQFIQGVTIQGCICFFQGEVYIRQYPSPLAIFPLRTALGGSIHFLIALVISIVLAGLFRGFANPSALLCLAPNFLIILVFVWSTALLAGMATVMFQDTQNLAEVGFQMLFYMSPIIYPRRILENSSLSWVADLNPIVAFLDLIRTPIMDGRIPSSETYMMAMLTTLAAFTVACLVLYRMQRKLIFHL